MDNIRPSNIYEAEKFSNFLELISEVHDPRVQGRVTYVMRDIIVMIVFALLGGANTVIDVYRYAWNHIDWFEQHLHLTNVPSYKTFLNVLAVINPPELEGWLDLWRYAKPRSRSIEHIAIDGKVDNANSLHAVRAFDVERQETLAYMPVPIGTNEIPVIPPLLHRIDCHGAVITGDAINAQRKIVSTIVNGEADYVLALKQNQGTLYDDVKLYFEGMCQNITNNLTYSTFTTTEKNRDRIEERSCVATSDIAWLPNRMRWRGLKTIAMIISVRIHKGKRAIECRYFISSLEPDAKKILQYIRNHWKIENNEHRNLDIVMGADYCTLRHRLTAINFAILRNFALNLLRNVESVLPLNARRIKNALSISSTLKTLLKPAV